LYKIEKQREEAEEFVSKNGGVC